MGNDRHSNTTSVAFNVKLLAATALCGILASVPLSASAQTVEKVPAKRAGRATGQPQGEAGSQGSGAATTTEDMPVEEIVVTATDVSHLAERTRTGTRLDIDPLTVPLAVSTVKAELIQRQQALTLSDVIANVSGVTGGIQGSASTRGFGANVMRNGNLGADGQSNDLPMIAFSSVEVVKGPEAIIAGVNAGYGGIVNIISKVPVATPVLEAMGTVGSRGYTEFGIDVGGALNEDKSVLVRFVGATQHMDHNVAGYDGKRSDYLAPSVTFRNPATGSEFTAQYEWQNIRKLPDVIVATDGTSLTSDLPIRRLSPASDGIDVRSRLLTLTLEQKLFAGWSAALRYSNNVEDRSGVNVQSFPFTFFQPFPNIFTFRYDQTNRSKIEVYKAELRGKFDTGPIAHNLLLAYDQTDADISVYNAARTLSTTNLATGVTTDRTATFGPIFGVPGPRVGGGETRRDTGLLALDQMTWGKLVVLAGVRRLTYDSTPINGAKPPSFTKVLPSIGATFRFTPDLSLYANASRGFQPNQGLFGYDGNVIPPEQAQQYEIGAKALLFRERVAASLSYFDIRQKNVAAIDLARRYPAFVCAKSTNLTCYVTVDGQRSQGAEFDLSGMVLPGLELRGNYRYQNITLDPGATSATLYARNEGSLWATYNFQPDRLGPWIGGGVKARSAQAGAPANAGIIRVPGQVRTDLSAGYDARTWSATLGVKNVFDQRLYLVASGALSTGFVDQPREALLTFKYKYR